MIDSHQRRQLSWLRAVCTALGIGAVAQLTGCQAPAAARPRVADTGAKVEILDESPQLTPADRQQRFRSAYETGMQWVARREYALAHAAFEEALRMQPESLDAMFNVAACYEQIGEPARAIAMYKHILAVSPNDAECYHNLGTSYIKLAHLEKSRAWRDLARQAWRRSLELKPDQPELRRYLAQLGDSVE